METFFHRLHERRETLKRDELSKRQQWREDERRVRNASCDFIVKNYGDLEHPTQFSFFKNKPKSLDSLYHFGTLHISGDGLRFADDSTDDVLVESPIEKISFCGPVKNGKYFGYICREEIQWKWICHTFKITEDHADRVNNAVGCAFHVCLEKKHKARMEQSKALAAAPPPQATAMRSQNSAGSIVGRPGTNATPALNQAFEQSSQVAASAHRSVSQGFQTLEPHIDDFDTAWESIAPRDTEIQLTMHPNAKQQLLDMEFQSR